MYITPFAGLDKGGQVSLYYLIQGLNKNKYIPYLILPQEGKLSHKVSGHNCKVFYRSLKPIKLKNLLRNIKDILWMRKIIMEKKIDVIHTDRTRDTFQCIVASAFTNAIVIWHVRVKFSDRPLDFINKFFVKRIIGITDHIEDRFSGIFWDSSKFKKIYNGIDLDNYIIEKDELVKMRESLSINKDAYLVTSVSQLVEQKGLLDFIRAAKIISRNNKNVYFLIVGTGSKDYKERLKQLIINTDLENQFKLLGYREDASSIIAASDVFVMASHDAEGGPRTVQEAMAAGVAIVATNIPGPAELLTEDTGILVEEKDPSAIANAIQLLIDNEDIKKKFGIEGKKRAEKLFNLKSNVLEIQKLYEEI